MAAHGEISQLEPILVCRVTVTCAASVQLAPITALPPITQYGPMMLPSPITAPSSIRAVGSILAIDPSSVGQHRADIGFRHDLSVDLGIAMEPPHGLAPADAAHVVLDGVTGTHRLSELALVDGEEIHRARLVRAFHRFDADDASGLRHGLDHHH